MKYIIVNWKSNKSISQAGDWFKELSDLKNKPNSSEKKDQKIELIITPSFPLLSTVQVGLESLKNSGSLKWSLGVQDLSPFPAGSYTGAVSIRNLAGLEVKYAVLGHSERRRHFGEDHFEVAKKVEQALDAGITPIVCVDVDYIEEQAVVLKNEYLKKCIVVYEPLASIGTGRSASVGRIKQAEQMVKQHFGDVKFLYGGSVDENNVNEYLLVTDGIILGKASLDAKQFARLVLAAHGQDAAET